MPFVRQARSQSAASSEFSERIATFASASPSTRARIAARDRPRPARDLGDRELRGVVPEHAERDRLRIGLLAGAEHLAERVVGADEHRQDHGEPRIDRLRRERAREEPAPDAVEERVQRAARRAPRRGIAQTGEEVLGERTDRGDVVRTNRPERLAGRVEQLRIGRAGRAPGREERRVRRVMPHLEHGAGENHACRAMSMQRRTRAHIVAGAQVARRAFASTLPRARTSRARGLAPRDHPRVRSPHAGHGRRAPARSCGPANVGSWARADGCNTNQSIAPCRGASLRSGPSPFGRASSRPSPGPPPPS